MLSAFFPSRPKVLRRIGPPCGQTEEAKILSAGSLVSTVAGLPSLDRRRMEFEAVTSKLPCGSHPTLCTRVSFGSPATSVAAPLAATGCRYKESDSWL